MKPTAHHATSQTSAQHAGAGDASDASDASDAGVVSLPVLLWTLLGSALAWSLHLGVSYALLAYACTTGWQQGARLALGLVSVLALVCIAWSAWVARRRWHVARVLDQPVDDVWNARMGERSSRTSFLMVTGLFLSLLFAIGVVYSAITLYALPLCAAGLSA